jgi:peptidoglycan hydrolase CwlO-like protein
MIMEKIVIKIINSIGSVWSLIIHTVLFLFAFIFCFLGYNFSEVLLVLTTIVSLEAIYLSILIQLSVNIQSKVVQSIQEDVEGIQEDVEGIQEDVEEINEDEEDDEDIKKIKETMMVIQKTLGVLMREVTELKKKQIK